MRGGTLEARAAIDEGEGAQAQQPVPPPRWHEQRHCLHRVSHRSHRHHQHRINRITASSLMIIIVIIVINTPATPSSITRPFPGGAWSVKLKPPAATMRSTRGGGGGWGKRLGRE